VRAGSGPAERLLRPRPAHRPVPHEGGEDGPRAAGLDQHGARPAVYLAACFEPPATPLGCDELSIAGGFRGRPVELVDCVSIAGQAIAHAEIVLEGEILPGERTREDAQTNTGYSMPEFLGYPAKRRPSFR